MRFQEILSWILGEVVDDSSADIEVLFPEGSGPEGIGAEGFGADIEVEFSKVPVREVPVQKVLAQKVPVQNLGEVVEGCGCEKMKRHRRRIVKLLGIAPEGIGNAPSKALEYA